jgi:spermidine/putrescine transport system permease protein
LLKSKKSGFLAVFPLAWMVVFFVVPTVLVILMSFMKRGTYGETLPVFTLEHYGRLFDGLYARILLDSLAVAVLTTALCLLAGYPLAYHISRQERRRQRIWLMLIMLPFLINFLIRSYAWVILLRAQGVVNTVLIKLGLIGKPLPLLYNDGAVLLGMVYGLLPFMVLPVYIALERADRRKLEAAYDLGATPLRAFWHVTLPLTIPGVLTGVTLVFVSSVGMFVVPEVMGGAQSALIGNVIQNQFLSARNWPFGSALSVILTLVSLAMIALLYRAFRTAGREERPR